MIVKISPPEGDAQFLMSVLIAATNTDTTTLAVTGKSAIRSLSSEAVQVVVYAHLAFGLYEVTAGALDASRDISVSIDPL